MIQEPDLHTYWKELFSPLTSDMTTLFYVDATKLEEFVNMEMVLGFPSRLVWNFRAN
jgi:hypothetical protein